MTKRSFVRTLEDLIATVTAIARLFKTDKVFIIGSQSILLSWPDAPVVLRTSGEIDAYPENAKIWEFMQKQLDPDGQPEASEEINALFGEGSEFHREHGFYIDGVDENTACLPEGWNMRAISKTVDVDGRQVLAVAPCPEDIIVSKLARLSEKDKAFVEAYHAERPVNPERIIDLIEATKLEAALQKRAIAFVGRLAKEPDPDTASS